MNKNIFKKVNIIFSIIVLTSLLLVAGCKKQQTPSEKLEIIKMENKINIKTEDNLNITAVYSEKGKDAVILLHMFDKTKEDWNDFSKKLLNNNFSVIAIDLRGHGESDLNWKTFDEKDFNNMLLDVKAAHDFLKNKGATSIQIVGASIGANLALNYAAKYNGVRSIVLLSPGRNYKGIETEETIKSYKGPVLIVASNNDPYSMESSKYLFDFSPSDNKQIEVYEKAGHGTRMFNQEEPDLAEMILNWLEKYK